MSVYMFVRSVYIYILFVYELFKLIRGNSKNIYTYPMYAYKNM